MAGKSDRKTVAARLGISTQRLGQLIRAGQISEADDGIDADVAVAEYERNTDKAKREAARIKTQLRVVRSERPELANESRVSIPAPAPGEQIGGAGVPSHRPDGAPAADLFDYNRAKARKEHFNAERARIETEQRLGNLVTRDEVKAKAFSAARICRDRLLGLPPRLATFVPAEHMQNVVDEVESIIRDLEAAMSDL